MATATKPNKPDLVTVINMLATRARLKPARVVDAMLSEPQTETFNIDEVGIWKRTISVRDILSTYRARYTPKAGSPAIDVGDPAGGAGNDIGAVGAGTANAMDKFGVLP